MLPRALEKISSKESVRRRLVANLPSLCLSSSPRSKEQTRRLLTTREKTITKTTVVIKRNAKSSSTSLAIKYVVCAPQRFEIRICSHLPTRRCRAFVRRRVKPSLLRLASTLATSRSEKAKSLRFFHLLLPPPQVVVVVVVVVLRRPPLCFPPSPSSSSWFLRLLHYSHYVFVASPICLSFFSSFNKILLNDNHTTDTHRHTHTRREEVCVSVYFRVVCVF